MKNALPGRGEWIVFVAMALVAGLIVLLGGQRDTMLFFVTLPVFLVAALMGFRRSLAVQRIEVQPAEAQSAEIDSADSRA